MPIKNSTTSDKPEWEEVKKILARQFSLCMVAVQPQPSP